MLPLRVENQIDAFAGRPEELIQLLHLVQEEMGYVPEEIHGRIASALGVSIGRIHGVVTFYHLFRTRPAGRHMIRLCQGTACHVRGAEKILTALQSELNVCLGETTEDGLFTLESVRCLGTCSLAPVMMIDEEVYGSLTRESVREVLRVYQEGRRRRR